MTRAMARRQTGLSLIELMIGITLSSLLILGVVQVFLSSKVTYTSNQALSAVQESGRFAIELLAEDIRNAGYKGQCLSMPISHLDGGSVDLWSLSGEPIHGWEAGQPDFISRTVVDGSDTLFIQFAAGGTDVNGVPANSTSANTIDLASGSGASVVTGEVVLISDGLACDLFENTSNAEDAISKAAGVPWSHDYTDEFEILSFQSLAYYVAEDDDGVPTLYRSRFSVDLDDEDEEALVPGVASLNIEYGMATDRVVNDYVSVSDVTDWGHVAAVKLTLEIEAPSGLKKEFSTIVGLRNRLP